jgi:hypothetical protein
MKTTLNLPDALLDAVKQRAFEEGRTQTSVIEEAIRQLLSAERPETPHPMPTFGNPGENALRVALEDKDALYTALEGKSAA